MCEIHGLLRLVWTCDDTCESVWPNFASSGQSCVDLQVGVWLVGEKKMAYCNLQCRWKRQTWTLYAHSTQRKPNRRDYEDTYIPKHTRLLTVWQNCPSTVRARQRKGQDTETSGAGFGWQPNHWAAYKHRQICHPGGGRYDGISASSTLTPPTKDPLLWSIYSSQGVFACTCGMSLCIYLYMCVHIAWIGQFFRPIYTFLVVFLSLFRCEGKERYHQQRRQPFMIRIRSSMYSIKRKSTGTWITGTLKYGLLKTVESKQLWRKCTSKSKSIHNSNTSMFY